MKDCNQCGKCCLKYEDGGLSASQTDIEMWEIFNPDIAEYVKNGEIWFDPQTGKQLTACPFLELAAKATPQAPNRYTCSIYPDRPEDCRHYPSLVSEMIRDECEMIELVDIENPQQAEKTLTRMMADSRPA